MNGNERDSDAKLLAFLEAAVDGIVIIDGNGVIDTVNGAAQRLFGYDAAEMLGHNVSMLMPEPYCSAHDGYISAYRSGGDARIIGKGREVTGLRKDGSTFPMDLSVGEASINNRVYFTGIIKDLTRRKSAESEALRLGRIIDQAPVEVYVFAQSDLRFLLASRAAQLNLGYDLHEMLELTPVDLKPEFTEADFRAVIAPLINGEREEIAFSTLHRRKDGSTYDIDVRIALSRAETPPVFIATIEDVSERRRLEEQLRRAQRMEAVGQLTGGIAHDFNNLLTVIMGNLELMEPRLEDATLRVLLDEAQEAVELGATLTDRLLTYARRQPLAPEVIDLNEVLLGMTDLLRRTLGEGVDISTILAHDLWTALVDPGQVESALLNLAINARDAMAGSGRLTIESRNAEIDEEYTARELGLDPGQYVLVSVSDTGTGMTADVVERAFDPFFTTKEPGHGTGLGLSMVYGFAKGSRGHVTIYSEEGVGTTINLYLPRSDQDAVVPAAGKPKIAGLRDALILVVEDDERVRRVTLQRLESLGYRAVEAADGATALRMLDSIGTVDLVLSDVVMPGGMSGFELRDVIASRFTGTPVLLTSGYAEAAMRREDGDTGDLLFLRKPYRIADLADAVSDALARRG